MPSLTLTNALVALGVFLISRFIAMPLFFRERIDYSGKVRCVIPLLARPIRLPAATLESTYLIHTICFRLGIVTALLHYRRIFGIGIGPGGRTRKERSSHHDRRQGCEKARTGRREDQGDYTRC